MKEYRVTLKEDRGDKFTLVFDCWADDPEHAREQAQDMYPNGVILCAFPKDEL